MALGVLVWLWKDLIAITVHEDLAKTEGVNIIRTQIAFMILFALVIAIGAGLLADNTATTVLLRGVLAMGLFWIIGYGAGWTLNRAVHAESRSACNEDLGNCGDSDDSLQADKSAAEAQEHREAA